MYGVVSEEKKCNTKKASRTGPSSVALLCLSPVFAGGANITQGSFVFCYPAHFRLSQQPKILTPSQKPSAGSCSTTITSPSSCLFSITYSLHPPPCTILLSPPKTTWLLLSLLPPFSL
ncbi:hypothetical protein AOXY_G4384 [Acipenser oxyrinchus oxyrinchus]|uniref:Uncharacterized protein n=1 Tax=Acipenser oxyrinchus oxyrinchus TaxID=40147 RepID=A0AAD8GH43_ACIOX|nr:hypothetical protein AOXY_G4384 [Acipenser oxyrinchus oxyrinchus]